MDIQMPIMNGYEALNNYTKCIRIHRRLKKAIEIGGNGYISKPIDKSKLIDHINNQMTSNDI
jgi:CheY-like chemotaxis protein